MHRIRRKRKVSSELDPRWGDMAISSPNEGSWSQYGASSRTSPVSAGSFDRDHEPKHSSGEPIQPHITKGDEAKSRNEVTVNSLNMPTGYYDSKLRRQKKTRAPKAQPVQPKPITLPKSWEEKFGDSSADEAVDNVSTLGSPQRRKIDDANSRGSKSPPLSVTSRMRRHSGQSTTTDPIFSVPATASSQRTSFSADDPRLARHTPLPPQPDKKPSQGLKVRDAVLNTASQELVPSYDDLYG
ncbi:hypothetical protein BDW75DRAFT_227668 [Aspergillus navahoensis]